VEVGVEVGISDIPFVERYGVGGTVRDRGV